MGKKSRIRETEEGGVLYNIDPIIMKWPYQIDYIHSYAQDSPFFQGLSKGKLMGSACMACPMKFATPRSHCMHCGAKTRWMVLPHTGTIHTYTTCHFGGEAFLEETPFTLIMVEFEAFDTLLLSRLVGAEETPIRIGMAVEARFLRNSRFLATDVYFILKEVGHNGLSSH
ncbi:MAG: Zn-ribbon domain-containing OB-fold protein [Nitrospiria bacterium]